VHGETNGRNCVNSFTDLHIYLNYVCYQRQGLYLWCYSQAHKRIYGSHDLVASRVVYLTLAYREDITRKMREFFSYLLATSTVSGIFVTPRIGLTAWAGHNNITSFTSDKTKKLFFF